MRRTQRAVVGVTLAALTASAVAAAAPGAASSGGGNTSGRHHGIPGGSSHRVECECRGSGSGRLFLLVTTGRRRHACTRWRRWPSMTR